MIRGGIRAARHELAERGTVIGRAPGCDVCVPSDPRVAAVHAEIRSEEGQWILIRSTVRNSLMLNGHNVEAPLPLRSGDQMTLGETRILFEDPEEKKRSPRGGLEPRPAGGPDRECWLPSGNSKVIRDFVETLRRFASSDATLLLLGETGTGKEVAARAVHRFSARRNHPFVVVNCPALPSSLVESELFGIERGVATGVEPRKGLLESANHGTLFLDEVGDLEPGAQAKLLRFLQERTIDYVGGRRIVHLDVRVVAATHHDLDADVAAGRFRLDLHHRLKVLTVHVPSLRERLEDIPLLIDEFRCGTSGSVPSVSAEALRLLEGYDWPGNVRELQHVVQSLDMLVEDGAIRPEHLPEEIRCRGRVEHGTLYRQVVEEKGSFWELVQKPFLRRQLSRDEVGCFVARTYEEAGRSYLRLSRLLHIEDDYKKLVDFLGRHQLGVAKRATSAPARPARASGRGEVGAATGDLQRPVAPSGANRLRGGARPDR